MRSLSLLFIAGAIILVVLAAVAGFYLIGSPAHIRAVKLDERRVEELKRLDNAINNIRRAGNALPASLDDVVRMPAWDHLRIADPGTGAPYEYRAISPDEFELCAIFALSTDNLPGEPSAVWRHPSGRHCFSLNAKATAH